MSEADEFAPVAPGEILNEEFLAEYGLSQNQLAKVIGVSPNRIAEIVNNRRRITADTALRLGLYFGNSPEFWMNLQTHYDLKMARRNLKAADAKRIKARRAAGSPERESSTLDGCKPGSVAGFVLIEGQHVATRDGCTGFVDVGLGPCQIIALLGRAF